jgi:hypothetical protein
VACCPTAHGDTSTASPASACLITRQERLFHGTQHQLIALARLTDHEFQVLGEEIAIRHQGLRRPPHLGEVLGLRGITFFNRQPWITPCLAGFPRHGEGDRRTHELMSWSEAPMSAWRRFHPV